MVNELVRHAQIIAITRESDRLRYVFSSDTSDVNL